LKSLSKEIPKGQDLLCGVKTARNGAL
jgi:hypothetical protein